MSSRLYWQQLERAYRARSVVWLVCGLILLTFIWASLAQLDEVVVGEGKVVPAHAVQKIQSLEGGILQLMQVYEGQIVEAGAELAKLDDTRFRSAYQEAQQEQTSLFAGGTCQCPRQLPCTYRAINGSTRANSPAGRTTSAVTCGKP